MSLLQQTADTLESAAIPYALIGAAAMAIYGAGRATSDADLLVTDTAVLRPEMWAALVTNGVTIDIRKGGFDDPLGGVVGLSFTDDRDVDVVLGKWKWQKEVIDRAELRGTGGMQIPVARIEDLIILKLYAGGAKDAWDIEKLLESREQTDRARLVEAVTVALPQLPNDARILWKRIRSFSEPADPES